jgi:hypothetical protein
MKINTFLFLGVAILATSCFDAPQFPDTPKIEFKNIIFKDIGTNTDPDSLIILIYFEDGDGDLGIGDKEINSPFNQKIYFNKNTGEEINALTDSYDDLIKFSDRTKSIILPDSLKSLPDFTGSATCYNWDKNDEILLSDGEAYANDDTLYFQFNPRHYNYLIDFYLDKGTGLGFEFFDWRLINFPTCQENKYGRFEIINADGKPKATEGTIRYGMQDTGFKLLFKDFLIKLEITILDRNENRSNTETIGPFKLSDID